MTAQLTNADLQRIDDRAIQAELYVNTVRGLVRALELLDYSEANKAHTLCDLLVEHVTGIAHIGIGMSSGAVVFVQADLPLLGAVTVTL